MKSVKTIYPYLLLSFFFGTSFVIAPNSGSDSQRYAIELKKLHENQLPFDVYFSDIYSEESSKLDIYQPLLTWTVAQFTGNYQWLFGVFAMVFGFFWFKSLQLFRGLMPDKLNAYLRVLLVFFALINPIWSINGARMWTAVAVFFHGLLAVHILGNKKGYFFLLISLFMHFSLIIPLALYILFRMMPIRNYTILFGIYLITFFIGELDLKIIREYFELIPGALQTRKSYLSEAYVEGVKVSRTFEQYAVHIRIYNNLYKYIVVFMVSWIYISSFFKKAIQFTTFTRYFALGLTFSIFSNLVIQIPSGGRFVILSNLLVVSCFIWFLVSDIKAHVPRIYQNITFFILLVVIIVQIRIGADYFGAYLFIGNPIANLFSPDTTPFVEYLKALLL